MLLMKLIRTLFHELGDDLGGEGTSVRRMQGISFGKRFNHLRVQERDPRAGVTQWWDLGGRKSSRGSHDRTRPPRRPRQPSRAPWETSFRFGPRQGLPDHPLTELTCPENFSFTVILTLITFN